MTQRHTKLQGNYRLTNLMNFETKIHSKLNLAVCGRIPSIVSTSWDLLLQYGDGLTYENKVTYYAGRMKRKYIVCIFESLSDSE